ncbi:mannose-6-phosphate isomerase, class I [Ligilactobacillus cholophilus]|uniref:mannose-6-phosphate isomerase, class I n=1 Tax=Ligilactobacillus cholophilus TaxID=3050131 RepID=UPI0025AEF4D1|nr:mannose-6-phosphate isomerase, class I [Ligilactobacillus cholophilus]
MNEPIFLKPFFQEKIWGGKRLKDEFDYDIPSNHTGECWAISAHPHGLSIVENGPFKGKSLEYVWKNHREEFGNAKGDVFPLLVKILDAKDDLSVQVHPDDAYAEKHEHELGKNECWYVIKADKGAQIYYGHNAKSRSELKEMIYNHEWNKLFRKKTVHEGDFIYVPSGTVHALGKGLMVLETQQSSDTTYRIYDFDRIDPHTKQKRKLHLKQSVECISVPQKDWQIKPENYHIGDVLVTRFISNKFFSVYKWVVDGGSGVFKQQAPYMLVSVLDGSGSIKIADQEYLIKKGMHFILPFSVKSWKIQGNLQIIASEPGKSIC